MTTTYVAKFLATTRDGSPVHRLAWYRTEDNATMGGGGLDILDASVLEGVVDDWQSGADVHVDLDPDIVRDHPHVLMRLPSDTLEGYGRVIAQRRPDLNVETTHVNS